MFRVSYFISTLDAFNTLIQVIYRIHARYEEEGSFCAILCFLARFLAHRVFMSSGLTGRSIRLECISFVSCLQPSGRRHCTSNIHLILFKLVDLQDQQKNIT